MNKERLKQFIIERSYLKARAIAISIGYDPSNFNQWLKGKRSLPDEYADKLEVALEKYGYELKPYNK